MGMSLYETGPEAWEGSLLFRGIESWGVTSVGLYDLRAELVDGTLVATEWELVEASETEGMWCFGDLSLGIDARTGVLVGDYYAGDCDCEGYLALSEAY